MNRHVLIAAILLPTSTPLWAQQKEGYHQQVLIQAKWGRGPGEYEWRLDEGEPLYPKVFGVDANEHIYILDEFHNRVRHYDDKGNFIGTIPIASFAPATETQKKQLGPIVNRSVWINDIQFIDGAMHAIQSTYWRPGKPMIKALKLQGDRFITVDASTAAAGALEKMCYGERQEPRVRAVLGRDPKYREKSGREQHSSYDGVPVGRVFVDQNNNRWIMSASFGQPNRKYSPAGQLLYEFLGTQNDEAVIISPRGNIFVLSLFSRNPAATLEWPSKAQGIQITKYSL